VDVEYLPPRDEDIDALAFAVCKHMAETRPEFTKLGVPTGFAKFLKVIVRIRAEQLNRESTISKINVSKLRSHQS
jgi:hypothetical protein